MLLPHSYIFTATDLGDGRRLGGRVWLEPNGYLVRSTSILLLMEFLTTGLEYMNI